MANQKAEVYSNYYRVFLLSLLKENPLNVSDLAKKLNISRRAVYHHLKHLQKNQLVKKLPQEKHSQGQPAKWCITDKAEPTPKAILVLANKIFKLNINLKEKSKKK